MVGKDVAFCSLNIDEVILEGTFSLYPNGTIVSIELTNEKFTIKNGATSKIILLKDVIGCRITDGNKTTNYQRYITLFSYPIKNKFLSKNIRHRCSKSFGIHTTSNNADSIAKLWSNTINFIIRGNEISKDDVSSFLEAKENQPTVVKRNFLVYVNPFSGSGKAWKMYSKHLVKLLAEADIKHKCIKTEYQYHAHKDIMERDLSNYDAIIIVSGDGLIHEVVNGVMKRSDRDSTIRIPIGVLPGGSGNALAASIVHQATGKITTSNHELMMDCLHLIGRFKSRDLSLVSVQQNDHVTDVSQSEGCVYSFLNVGWGFLADVDIESERYRFFGGFRFTIGSIVRAINMRKYKGNIKYRPCKKSTYKPLNQSNLTHITRMNVNDELTAFSTAQRARTDSKAELVKHEARDETLEDDWIELEDDFVFVTAIYLSHLAGDMWTMPPSQLHEDTVYLYCLRYGISKAKFLQCLLAFENGDHIKIGGEFVTVIPCTQVKLTPLSKHGGGYLTVDGELVKYEPVTIETTKFCARVIG